MNFKTLIHRVKRIKNYQKSLSKMGFCNTLVFIWKTKIIDRILLAVSDSGSYQTGKLKSKELLYPIDFRYNSSDIPVFYQIFLQNEYDVINVDTPPKLIIDLGANVDYSTAYFLSKYPSAHVIAVEPDNRNFEILRKNLQPYKNRVTKICSAVWSHKSQLKLIAGKIGDQREWATKVKECAANESADLEAVDIFSLLEQSGFDKIDILKIDIEGAESVVFSENYKDWLDRVRIIVIELHGKKCQDIFNKALSLGNYDFSRSGEVTIAKLLSVKPKANLS